MNDKYIQALILGTLIGSAILLDDFIKPGAKKHQTKNLTIKEIEDFIDGDLSSIEGLQDLNVLQNLNTIEGLDLENLEDMDVEVKVTVKKFEEDETN